MNEAVDAPVAAASSPNPGGRLAEARQAQNLTPADVARQLKLSVWQVEALEAGRFERLPGAIFVRGFIRNYARLLKVDPNELLRAADDCIAQAPPSVVAAPSPDIPFPGASRSRWPMLAGAGMVVVGLLAGYEFYWNAPEPQPASAVAVTRPAVEPGRTPPAAAAPTQPVPESAAAPAIALATVLQATQDVSPVAAGEKQSPEAEKTPKPGERQLRFVFEQESWVEVRDRNERVIFSQLNSPGTQQVVNGMPPFSIVVGNAQGVRVNYGDKPVDLAPHTRTDVARLILQ